MLFSLLIQSVLLGAVAAAAVPVKDDVAVTLGQRDVKFSWYEHNGYKGRVWDYEIGSGCGMWIIPNSGFSLQWLHRTLTFHKIKVNVIDPFNDTFSSVRIPNGV